MTLALAGLALLFSGLSLLAVASKRRLRPSLSGLCALLLVLGVLLWLCIEAPLAASLWQVQHRLPLLHCH
jgi:hypothetical protein